MNASSDHAADMTLAWLIDDETIEALLQGEPVEPGLDRLAAFARDARAVADQPPPPASPDLMTLLASGDTSVPLTVPVLTARSVTRGRPGQSGRSARLTPAATKVAGLSLAAKVAVAASVAAAGTLGAGAAGVLPSQANGWVRHAIEAVTPVEFGEPARDTPDDRFGSRVSLDATGESDGEPGVDGHDIADEAPGANNRPADPGRSADARDGSPVPDAPPGSGLDRAQDTPASPNLPTDLPAGEGQKQPSPTPPSSTSPTTTPPQAPKSGAGAGPAGAQRSATGGGSLSGPTQDDGDGAGAPKAQPANPDGP